MKTIYLSHGDKGGTGKSFVANTIGSFFEMNKQPFLLIEADANENGGQPDVGPRFELSEYAQVASAPISGAGSSRDLIAQLFELIDSTDVEHIVINTPAGASEVLDDVGELLGMACKELGLRLVIFYSLFKTDVALKQAEKVMHGSLAKYAHEIYLVKNHFFGTAKISKALNSYPVFEFDVIHENVMRLIKEDESLAEALIRLPVLQRIQLNQFFEALKRQDIEIVLQLLEA